MTEQKPTIAIIGAGPIGLDAALAAVGAGHPVTVFETSESAGGNVRRWGHMELFTPWSMNVSERMRAVVGAPPDGEEAPTGARFAAGLLDAVAASPQLAGRVRFGARVEAVAREGLLKHEEIGSERRAARRFRLLVSDTEGRESIEHADVVVDCTGTYGHPNALGDGGIAAPGERALEHRIDRHVPDLERDGHEWAGRAILLTGAGHSAQTAARALDGLARHAPGTRVIWAVRSPAPDWGAVAADPLPRRRALTESARAIARGESDAVELRCATVTESLEPRDGRIAVSVRNGRAEELVVDRVLALNGGVGDFSLYRQLQVHECYATGAPMRLSAALLGAASGDCLAQTGHGPESLVNPEPGFFILGAKSYGRNSRFLLQIGFEQVDELFGSLLGRG